MHILHKKGHVVCLEGNLKKKKKALDFLQMSLILSVNILLE